MKKYACNVCREDIWTVDVAPPPLGDDALIVFTMERCFDASTNSGDTLETHVHQKCAPEHLRRMADQIEGASRLVKRNLR
jgi:hypothetical protein